MDHSGGSAGSARRETNAGGLHGAGFPRRTRPQTVSLHTLVTGVIYRQPALLARAVAALDVLSGGRAGLGVGARQRRRILGLGFGFRRSPSGSSGW